MTESDAKAELREYLQQAREVMLWKLDGLSEYDIRRPMTPTGTNLLGMVKHLAGVEFGYFGDTFGRPPEPPLPWSLEQAMQNTDMWATAAESRDDITGLYRRAWAHSDATFEALPLSATGRVPWWPADRGAVTLRRLLVHVIADTERHAGQADIIRELLDGAAGLRPGNDSLTSSDPAWWRAYRDQVERAARRAAGQPEGPVSPRS
jgi:uncharacterized damage-inducible protein DinB